MATHTVRMEFDGDVFVSNDPAHPAVRDDVSLVSLSRDYESPAELTFSIPGWQPAELAPDKVVRVWVGADLVFDGLSTLPRVNASVGGEISMLYVCRDRGAIYRSAKRSPPEGLTNPQTSWTIETATLGTIINELFDDAVFAALLTEMGISTDPLFMGGCEAIPCLPVQVQAGSVDSVLRRIAAHAPGVRVFVDPNGGTPKYHFVNLFTAPTNTLTVESLVTSDVSIERSLDGRCGAVQTNSRQPPGGSTYESNPTLLAPAWNEELEGLWTVADWQKFADSGVETDFSPVFRKWSFAALPSTIPPDGAEILVDALVPSILGGVQEWTPIEVMEDSVDAAARTLMTKHPVLKSYASYKHKRLNLMIAGNARKGTCRLRWRKSGGGTVNVPGTRYPASGFAGTAYALAPTSMAFERQVEVPAGIDHAAYAQAAHAMLSEPILRGSFTMTVGWPVDLARLRRRVNLTSSTHGPTGYESLNAPVMGIAVEFWPGASLTVNVSTEHALPGGGV